MNHSVDFSKIIDNGLTGKDHDAKKTEWGLNAGDEESYSIKISRENLTHMPSVKEGSITVLTGREIVAGVSWDDSKIGFTFSKEYENKFKFDKTVFDYFDNIRFEEPLWRFLEDKPSGYTINLDDNFVDHMNAITNKICTPNDNKNKALLNNSITRDVNKSYTTKFGFDVTIPKLPIINLKFSKNFNISLDSEFPVREEVYHLGVNEMLPIVDYVDINHYTYFAYPLENMEDILINPIVNAVTSLGSLIKDAAYAFAGKIVEFFEDDKGLTIQNKERRYSTQLRQYSLLRSSRQVNYSTITFDFPGQEQSFRSGTKIDMEHYYPGGEVLGKTKTGGEIILISDVFFLNAYFGSDTLEVAPLGTFHVTGAVGADDLSFLEIPNTTPVAVYFKSINGDEWENLGLVDKVLESRGLGTYALGVDLTSDKEAPQIKVTKNNTGKYIDVEITDNMTVFWQKTQILVNGVNVNYRRNGSVLTVNLSDEQIANDIYLFVYTADLASNETTFSQLLSQEVGNDIVVETESNCKVYPNPANSLCYLSVSNNLLGNGISYAIVNISGHVFARQPITDEVTQLDISRLPSGIYFVVIYDDNRIVSNQKLIKK